MMTKTDAHKKICRDLNDLYARKNADYGDSFGKSFEEYGLTMSCIRLEDKLNRIKSLTKQAAQVSDESIIDTLMDLANYSIMTLVELTRNDEDLSPIDVYEPKWISVNDDMPTAGKYVLVYDAPHNLTHIACADCDSHWHDDQMRMLSHRSDGIITHWMPLPKVPVQEGERSEPEKAPEKGEHQSHCETTNPACPCLTCARDGGDEECCITHHKKCRDKVCPDYVREGD